MFFLPAQVKSHNDPRVTEVIVICSVGVLKNDVQVELTETYIGVNLRKILIPRECQLSVKHKYFFKVMNQSIIFSHRRDKFEKEMIIKKVKGEEEKSRN